MTGHQVDVLVADDVEVDEALLAGARDAVLAALHAGGVVDAVELSILFTHDRQLRQLNREFRQIDQVTDVLSFAGPGPMPGQSRPYLGDIAISLPQAGRQANEAGHSLMAELQLLTVHGVLHLLGHDHAAPADRAIMWQLQAAALTALGATVVAPTPSHDQTAE